MSRRRRTLELTKGDKRRTARRLGLDRRTLDRTMTRLRLRRARRKPP